MRRRILQSLPRQPPLPGGLLLAPGSPAAFDRFPETWRARHVFTRGASDEPVRLPYSDAAFDAVFSVGVLEHVRETGGSEAGSLAEISRLLRPGGLFLSFHLPNRLSWIESASRVVFRDDGDDEHRRYHAHRYSRGDIRGLWFVAQNHGAVAVRR